SGLASPMVNSGFLIWPVLPNEKNRWGPRDRARKSGGGSGSHTRRSRFNGAARDRARKYAALGNALQDRVVRRETKFENHSILCRTGANPPGAAPPIPSMLLDWTRA